MTDDIHPEGSAADADAPATTADVAYGEALRELETILDDLETSSIDIDHLAEQVARAAHLISLCRDRLRTVEVDVAAAVENLSSSNTPATTEPATTGPGAHDAPAVAT